MPARDALAGANDQRSPGHRSFFVQKSSGRPGLTYEPVQKLGEGAFGVAHLVRDRTSGSLYVLKTINKRQSQVPPAQLETEIRNLKACDHPHIIRLFEYYEDYENIYLIMERAAGGELQQVLQDARSRKMRLPERWVSIVIQQCLHAISYVHSMGIIHKDLKSENILLLHEVDVADPQSQPHAVLIDLGIAELFSARLGRRARCNVVAGTPTHMAPEVWCGNFGPVADVWSLGVVLFELLSGEVPFLCSSLNSAAEWVRLHRLGPNWLLLRHTSSQARAINQRMLQVDERMRPTAQQCLGHAWFKLAASGESAESAEPDETVVEDPGSPGGGSLHAPSDLPERVESALDDYTGRSKFEKVVMLQVASHLHTSQVGRIRDVFLAADRDSTGFVTHAELLATLGELGVEPGAAESYASCIDVDDNGRIDYTELVSGCIGLLYESLRGLLWQTFCVLDVDGNGVLGREDVMAVVTRAELVQHGFPGNEPVEVVREVVDRMDVDADGQISFDELCRHILPQRPLPRSGTYSSPGKSRSTMPAMHDEEFAQLLDQIEADHATEAREAEEQPLLQKASTAELVEICQGAGSAEPGDVNGIASGAVEEAGLAPEFEVGGPHERGSSSKMSVDEELSNLLADIANGP